MNVESNKNWVCNRYGRNIILKRARRERKRRCCWDRCWIHLLRLIPVTRYKKVGNWLAHHTLHYRSTADYILFVSCRGLLSIKGSWQFYLVQVTFSRPVPTRSSVCVCVCLRHTHAPDVESLVVNAVPENRNKNEKKSKTENKTTAAVEKKWNEMVSMEQ